MLTSLIFRDDTQHGLRHLPFMVVNMFFWWHLQQDSTLARQWVENCNANPTLLEHVYRRDAQTAYICLCTKVLGCTPQHSIHHLASIGSPSSVETTCRHCKSAFSTFIADLEIKTWGRAFRSGVEENYSLGLQTQLETIFCWPSGRLMNVSCIAKKNPVYQC